MKLTTKTTGEAELRGSDVTKALTELAKTKPALLLEAVTKFLQEKGYTTKKIAHSIDGNGDIVVRAQIESIQNDITSKLFSETESTDRKTPQGFKRKNVGFYKTLVEYLADENAHGKKEVLFDDMYDDMLFFFPSLVKRNAYIYVSDKRAQQTKGFYFNPDSKMLGLSR